MAEEVLLIFLFMIPQEKYEANKILKDAIEENDDKQIQLIICFFNNYQNE